MGSFVRQESGTALVDSKPVGNYVGLHVELSDKFQHAVEVGVQDRFALAAENDAESTQFVAFADDGLEKSWIHVRQAGRMSTDLMRVLRT